LFISLFFAPFLHTTYAACIGNGGSCPLGTTTGSGDGQCCTNTTCTGATSFGPGTCKAAPTPAPPPKCPNGSPGIPDGGDCPVKDLNGTDLNCCTTNAKCVKAGVDPQTRCIPPAGTCTLTGNCSSDGDCCSPNKCLPDTSKPGFNVNTCQSPTQLENPGPPPSPPCTSYSNGQCATVKSSLGDLSTDPGQFISKIFGFLIAIGGGIALLLIIRAGYRLMTSRGNPEGVQQGREQLIAAIVGLLFLIFSFVILEVIGVDILRIPGLGTSTGPGSGSACGNVGGTCMTSAVCRSPRVIRGKSDCGGSSEIICCQ